jgi:hypothetical protein
VTSAVPYQALVWQVLVWQALVWQVLVLVLQVAVGVEVAKGDASERGPMMTVHIAELRRATTRFLYT